MSVFLTNDQIIESYNLEIENRIKKYESLDFESFHPEVLPYLPTPPAHVLDIGAGSGRDAAFLVKKGFQVTAVEPAKRLLEAAQKRHAGIKISWAEDRLPELAKLPSPPAQYDVILLSAVWMHLSSKERKKAFSRVSELLKHNGIIIFSYKIGGKEEEGFYKIDTAQFDTRAHKVGLELLSQNINLDSLGRSELSWRCCIFKKNSISKT
ncbi:class I SAM-dependent methyltransferase [Maridesulfovibrio sp.]|uniref:class I SAM-dependent methyltransferase n=1 Tax=Maridesulfovibrio sp. TaxID=2795000 RepID=UPI002A188A18|nr:class I SAM-dependent methyltransferase [Maridesulfovibrio sp.]